MTSFSPNNLGTQDRQVYAKPALPVFFSATPSAINTGQNCSKIVGTYVFMDRENISKKWWEYQINQDGTNN